MPISMVIVSKYRLNVFIFILIGSLLPTLNLYKNYTINDYNQWSYCSSSKIVNQNVIRIWTLLENDTIVESKDNLVNVIEKTIHHVILS